MKKLISVLFLLTMCFAMTVAVRADNRMTLGGIEYDLRDDGTAVVVWTEIKSGELVIPATVEYGGKAYTVTEIGANAFMGRAGLTGILLPDTVETIRTYAFCLCTGLDRLVLPKSVSLVEDNAFANCSRLSVVIERDASDSTDKKEDLGIVAHSGTSFSGILALYVPMKLYNQYVTDCERFLGLTADQVIPYNENGDSLQPVITQDFVVGSIKYRINYETGTALVYNFQNGICPDEVFIPDEVSNKYALTTYTYNYSVVGLFNGSLFSGRAGLRSVRLPAAMPELEWSAFKDCVSLTEIILPTSLTKIGISAFDGCTNLPGVQLPDGTSEIGVLAFKDCVSLTEIDLPASLTKIGMCAFDGCTDLTVTIRNDEGVIDIGTAAFRNIEALKVPAALLDDYRAVCEDWGIDAEDISAIDNGADGGTSSVISGGNLWIIAAGAVIALSATAVLILKRRSHSAS